jgi:hypothetical protein
MLITTSRTLTIKTPIKIIINHSMCLTDLAMLPSAQGYSPAIWATYLSDLTSIGNIILIILKQSYTVFLIILTVLLFLLLPSLRVLSKQI